VLYLFSSDQRGQLQALLFPETGPAAMRFAAEAAQATGGDAASPPRVFNRYYGNCSSPVFPSEDIAAGPACPSPSKGVSAVKLQAS
jgi:hypothetical protein